MKDYLQKSFKFERELLELVALYFDLAYYTGNSHDKDTHIRKFISFLWVAPFYFLYVGSRDYTSLDLLQKVMDLKNKREEYYGIGSHIEIMQMKD